MIKKILHIITGLDKGGAEYALFQLLSNGLNENYENYVISLTGKGYYSEKLLDFNIKVIHINLLGGKLIFKELIKLILSFKRISPDLIQGWMYHGNFFAILFSLLSLRRIPCSLNIRQCLIKDNSLSLETKVINHTCAILSKYSAAIINNSSRSQKDHQKIGYSKRNNYLIHNGFDTKIFKKRSRKEIIKKLGYSNDDFIIGFVARNHPDKNYPLLLKTFYKLNEKYQNIKLICAGSGFEKLSHLNKNPSIKYLGFVSDLNNLLNCFDLFCIVSLNEGFPNVLGQAMSCEIPSISTDVGECSLIINNNDLIIDSDDEKGLYNLIHKMYKLEKQELEKLGRVARENIVVNFALSKTINNYHKVYRKILG